MYVCSNYLWACIGPAAATRYFRAAYDSESSGSEVHQDRRSSIFCYIRWLGYASTYVHLHLRFNVHLISFESRHQQRSVPDDLGSSLLSIQPDQVSFVQQQDRNKHIRVPVLLPCRGDINSVQGQRHIHQDIQGQREAEGRREGQPFHPFHGLHCGKLRRGGHVWARHRRHFEQYKRY